MFFPGHPCLGFRSRAFLAPAARNPTVAQALRDPKPLNGKQKLNTSSLTLKPEARTITSAPHLVSLTQPQNPQLLSLQNLSLSAAGTFRAALLRCARATASGRAFCRGGRREAGTGTPCLFRRVPGSNEVIALSDRVLDFPSQLGSVAGEDCRGFNAGPSLVCAPPEHSKLMFCPSLNGILNYCHRDEHM